MSHAAAKVIIRKALELSRLHPTLPAIEVLDLAMEGHRGSAPDFSVREGDTAEPQRRFGELLREAFAPAVGMALHEQGQREVLARFAQRYDLWRG